MVIRILLDRWMIDRLVDDTQVRRVEDANLQPVVNDGIVVNSLLF